MAALGVTVRVLRPVADGTVMVVVASNVDVIDTVEVSVIAVFR